jgi:DNA polymerase-3 subunit beta
MKLTVNKSAILPILAQCNGVADKKSTMPILGNVLLHANGALRCSATDLQQSVASDVAAKISEVGSIALPARGLLERIKMLDGDITLTTKGSAVTLKSGARVYKMTGIPGDDFPQLPTRGDDVRTLAAPASTLLRLITGAMFAVSTDETRQHLNGALLECGSGKVRMVSTDGHRLAFVELDAPEGWGAISLLIPLKGLLELRRLCEAGEGDDVVTLAHEGPNLFASSGGVDLSVKLTDSQFVPYRQVIPEKQAGETTVMRLSLLNAVRAVSVAAPELSSGIKLHFGGDTIVVEAVDSAGGEGRDEVSAVHTGPSVVVGTSAKYILDALASFETESVTIGVSGELDPLVIRPLGAAGLNALTIVMPMRQ